MSAREDEETPALPPNFRLRPSRNQKQRSRLKQASEPDIEPEPPITPAPEPVSKTPEPPPSRKTKMKRSGQMHEDLTAPVPEGPPPQKKDAY